MDLTPEWISHGAPGMYAVSRVAYANEGTSSNRAGRGLLQFSLIADRKKNVKRREAAKSSTVPYRTRCRNSGRSFGASSSTAQLLSLISTHAPNRSSIPAITIQPDYRMAFLTLLLLAASAICSTAFPAYFVQYHANGDCQAVPTTGIRSHSYLQVDP